jgi:hypothetical protein
MRKNCPAASPADTLQRAGQVDILDLAQTGFGNFVANDTARFIWKDDHRLYTGLANRPVFDQTLDTAGSQNLQ